MYHLDRRKTVSGQSVVALSAFLTCAVAGGGIGFWLGKSADSLNSDQVHLAAGTRMTQHIDTGSNRGAPTQTDAITSSLGNMQAELMRLNALGERLVEMSGLNPEEFDFKNPPPQGGPEEGFTKDYTIREIASELGSVVSLLKDRKLKLEILEEAITGKDLTAKSVPAGWPVRSGYITSNYGMRVHPIRRRVHFHKGVDFAAPHGSPVVAVADGIVTFSGRRSGYGNLVEIQHSDGYVTRYGHNSNNLVQEGQQIRRGQMIGAVGSTGTATGPHVHFEVLKDGMNENPMQFAGRQSIGSLVAANVGNPG